MATTNPRNVPALAPPPGVIPNFGDPYSLSPAFVVTAVLSLLLATAAVIMRLALGLIATCLLTVLEIHKGLGRHQWDVPLANMRPLLKLLYINRVCYSPTILAAKLTILLQLMRIFVPTKRGLVFRIIQILIWSNVCFYLANVLSVIFQCSPVPKAWNDSVKKLSVSAAFAAGIFANFAGIMRLAYSVYIIHGSDLTFIRLQHGMWTIAEITTAIICASLPLVPKFLNLFHQKRPGFISSASRPQGSISSESGLRPPRFSPEPFVWRDSGRGVFSASAKEEQVVVAGAYVPADEESALVRLDSAGKAVKDRQVSWYEGMEGEEGIRKTLRIEQSY
ncbi:hypothetical protein OEA41_007989 [Lepraria neglecta]|uniref:Rhodopsin domain-containing protein n=1 Tax=Lepraria neglecta TaxID=209136 RepID=A0AAE0DNF9_9LECA|nr:hypothetical protein OEA41_007989 [Lepraria neglecta]